MKPLPILLFLLLALCAARAAEEPASEVELSPAEGKIDAESSYTVSFPDAMIAGDKINAADVAWPISIEPKVDARFLWQSQTEGELQIQGVIVPGTKYRIVTAPGLKDLTGKKILAHQWEFASEPFRITTSEEERDSLSAKPRFDLRANYPVSLLEVAEHVFFQDRDSHERFPVEVVMSADQSPEREKSFTVTPRLPLPVEHTFDVMVDDLREAISHQPLAFLNVFPAGTTGPLELRWVAAFNHPLEPPVIRVKFEEDVDPGSVGPNALEFTPAVPNLRFHADVDELVAEGDFNPTQRYVVRVPKTILGASGYGLAEEEKWGATFHPKESTIVFPYVQVFQRSARGLKFAFLQVNTGPSKWTLSQIPPAELPAVQARVREFKANESPLALKVVGEGNFEANSDVEEMVRQIEWKPSAPLSGPYLLEVIAKGNDGTTVGNRTVISFSEYLLTQKSSDRKVYVRVAKMADIAPAAGLRVRALTRDNAELAHAKTDANGVATFDYATLYPERTSHTELFIADTPEGPAMQFANGSTLASAPYHRREEGAALRSLLVTDRNLYRPGQTVKMHGLARFADGQELSLPKAGEMSWSIKPTSGQEIATGTAPLSGHGSWDAEWEIPNTLETGAYEISCTIDGVKAFQTNIQVEEYRVPIFSVNLEQEEAGPVAQAKVSSAYFHGAPNASAKVRWKALWHTEREGVDDQFVRSDRYSEHHLTAEDEQEASGEAVLDKEGRATLRCEPPFKDGAKRGRCTVLWAVDVTSPEAQTLTAGGEYKVQLEKGWAGLKAESNASRKITFEVNAIDVDDEEVRGTSVRLDLFHVASKTVREKVGPFLVRYRNTREFEKVATKQVATPATFDLGVKDTGEYVAVTTSAGGVLASTNLTVAGDDPAELPVENETEIQLSLPEPARAYQAGETAPIAVRAPFGGVAWVSVEAEDVLDTMFVRLAGNAGRIDLPIKQEYAPNCTVTVYLVQPGGADSLPRERIGQLQLAIARPDLGLTVTPTLAEAKIRPGGQVHGEVTIQSEGRPVSGADLLVFAVDEAVLRLGGWSMPEPAHIFYPTRPLSVSSYAALSRFVEKIEPKSLLQKGYVVGDGGASLGQVSAVRKDLKTLAFWKAGLASDAAGKVRFDFQAPDNLTEFRLVAFGQTDASQFGGGTTTFKVAKPLMCEAALPRFVRIGDEVRLRAVARQSVKDSGQITVKCVTEGMELQQDQPQSREAEKDVPQVYNFKAHVADVSSGAKVRFEATSNLGESDAIELSLPILPPAVLRKETVAGPVIGTSFQPVTLAPASWLKGRGAYDVTISTTPWYPKLNGLPAILQYPHGCFEQISSRVLSYALMTDLLKSLPDSQQREANYRAMLETSLKRYDEGLLSSGLLPYWPGSTYPNYFVTVLAAWAVKEIEHVDLQPSEHLSESLEGSLTKIIADRDLHAGLLTRCLALMVVASPETVSDHGPIAQDLYLKRDAITDEGRAMLAVAMQRMGIMAKEKAQLLKEFAKPPAERAFDPDTFASTTRAEALITLAFAEASPNSPQMKDRREKMLKLMDSAASLSTQENLWLLVAFKAMHDAQPAVKLAVQALAPQPMLTAENGTATEWPQNDIARLSSFEINGLPSAAAKGTPLTALLSAEYRSTEPEVTRTDRGLRVERVVRNLTDAKRLGTAEAPFKLGDQVLVTYRLLSRHLLNYVALEDLLPAGLETVNPDLPLIAKNYQIPAEANGRELSLSHSELRDQATLLYFNVVEPGLGIYSVLSRATTAGEFRWPATQAYPMYDSRYTGLSTASICVVNE